jgi:hypothetical protein
MYLQYDTGKGRAKSCSKGEIKVCDDVLDYLLMFGILVPIDKGHMLIDFRQVMKYNCCKRLKKESKIKALSM